jgi:hypothetical protein
MISAGSGFAPAAGGMTTYYRGLLGALPGISSVDEVVAFVPPWDTGLRVDEGLGRRVRECEGLPEGRLGRVAYEHFRLPKLVREEECDVLLSTHNVRPLGWRGPSVVVLQAIQYFFLPDPIGRVRKAYLRAVVPWSLRHADVVITVSEAQRQDTIRLFDLDPDSLVNVHHGASPWAVEAGSRVLAGQPIPRPLAG